MREYYTNVIVIALSIVFLAHFGLIAKYGRISIGEPSPIILGLEVVIFLSLIAFAVVNIVKLRRSRRW